MKFKDILTQLYIEDESQQLKPQQSDKDNQYSNEEICQNLVLKAFSSSRHQGLLEKKKQQYDDYFIESSNDLFQSKKQHFFQKWNNMTQQANQIQLNKVLSCVDGSKFKYMKVNDENDTYEDNNSPTSELDESFTIQSNNLSKAVSQQQQEEQKTATMILQLFKIREKYILYPENKQYSKLSDFIQFNNKNEPNVFWNSKKIELPEDLINYEICIKNGVYQVLSKKIEQGSQNSDNQKPPLQNLEKIFNSQDGIPKKNQFLSDFSYTYDLCFSKYARTVCLKRLNLMIKQFKIHLIKNEQLEISEQKEIAHRDFFNVTIVDTHIHHSAAMHSKELLYFIKKKCKDEKDTIVYHDQQTDKDITLEQLYKKLSLKVEDLSLDSLQVFADSNLFDRFDNFNNKYNLFGNKELREVFLKTDNLMHGKYLAQITTQLIQEQELKSKHQYLEWRLSIYGKNKSEWSKLAKWVKNNNIYSQFVKWMIQIPRLFGKYLEDHIVVSFQQLLDNIFAPLFEVTRNPSIDPDLYEFLLQIGGFDTVDDESLPESLNYPELCSDPATITEDFYRQQLDQSFSLLMKTKCNNDSPDRNEELPKIHKNPHYIYWMYYLYANIQSLNNFRAHRGLNTFSFRPHSGEAGNIEHLIASYLVANGINHGIVLNQNPVLVYLYYLHQIGIAMSPLSNHKLFLKYSNSPFPYYFKIGLNVSLSTDDPMILHLTKEPLIEEYQIAQQVYNLSMVDMCEIAKNSVRQSSLEKTLKDFWINDSYDMREKNNKKDKTNIPDQRAKYRYEIYKQEWDFIKQYDNENFFIDIHENC